MGNIFTKTNDKYKYNNKCCLCHKKLNTFIDISYCSKCERQIIKKLK